VKHVIALVGRPNVGKSTLYNRLTKTRDALVADMPGLTRDRRYGRAELEGREFIVIDTGGLTGGDGIDAYIASQAKLAMEEADAILFLVDGREGLCAGDEDIARQLRMLNKPVFLTVNKTERQDKSLAGAEFHALGLGMPHGISSSHGEGISSLLDEVFAQLPAVEEEPESDVETGAKVAVIGRPNVGKSTLVNRLLGEDRVLAFDMPGTTRDSIHIPFEYEDAQYTLIDTAGVRRKGRIDDKVEKFSVIKTLAAIEESNVVILVLDAKQGISTQDAHLLGYAVEAGRALLIAVNKWDGMDPREKEKIKNDLERKLSFVDYASVHFISALHGSGVGKLMGVVKHAYQNANKTFQTNLLTRILEDAVDSFQPPLVNGRRIKLRYAHQGGKNPPIIVVHGNQTDKVPESYARYLERIFRKVLRLDATPIRMEFRSGENPYKSGRRNQLSDREMAKQRQLALTRMHKKKKGGDKPRRKG